MVLTEEETHMALITMKSSHKLLSVGDFSLSQPLGYVCFLQADIIIILC